MAAKPYTEVLLVLVIIFYISSSSSSSARLLNDCIDRQSLVETEPVLELPGVRVLPYDMEDSTRNSEPD
ncbi:hypothetical protein O6P43_014834 [Quillaja saponaria]|uniref:Uncharacterized protein n=1 Tax=Quillaja saponaria TaxID=32244 RepID=A0AAD7LVS5_QUISA|nr:hypothetical protein O6P43_014834 [Quillaja saponaria]